MQLNNINPMFSQYRNIIFDLGGVVLNIDYNLTIESFRTLGMPDAGELYSKKKQLSLFDDLEKGEISEENFYDQIRKLTGKNLTDEAISRAWNALILDLPEPNVALLNQLGKSHRIFLLSNTNSIHEKDYRRIITEQYGRFILDELFEKVYLSHRIHMRKPDPRIFEFVLSDAGLKADETLFIDDSPQHVKAAESIGLHAHHLQGSLTDYFIPFMKVEKRMV